MVCSGGRGHGDGSCMIASMGVIGNIWLESTGSSRVTRPLKGTTSASTSSGATFLSKLPNTQVN